MIKENKDIKMSIIFKLIYQFSITHTHTHKITSVCVRAHVLNLIILKITWSIKEVRLAKMG